MKTTNAAEGSAQCVAQTYGSEKQHLVDVFYDYYYYYLALPFILIMYSAYKLYSRHTFVDLQMN